MRSPGLTVAVVAGLAVVGYAFYMLVTSEPPRSQPTKVRAEARAKTKAGANKGPSRTAKGPRPRPSAQGRVASAPLPKGVGGAKPEPVEPEMSLEEARTQFADLMTELDDLIDKGDPLESPRWVEYYKRGNDALLPLQQHLDWKVPEHAEELRKANMDMRGKLSKLEPKGPAVPSAPPQ